MAGERGHGWSSVARRRGGASPRQGDGAGPAQQSRVAGRANCGGEQATVSQGLPDPLLDQGEEDEKKGRTRGAKPHGTSGPSGGAGNGNRTRDPQLGKQQRRYRNAPQHGVTSGRDCERSFAGHAPNVSGRIETIGSC